MDLVAGGAKWLKSTPIKAFGGTFAAPASKPETQRAILAATLADGASQVFGDLRCVETDLMKAACRDLGATIIEHSGHLEIAGVAGRPRATRRVIDAGGSGLVFRTVAAIASAAAGPVVVTGDATLRKRVMLPLFQALKALGASVDCVVDAGKAPVVNWGGGFAGGRCALPGDISSQFISAVLFAAPLARGPVEVNISGDIYSASYIRQTLDEMARSGIAVETSQDLSSLKISPGRYRPHRTSIRGDYTSASYLLAAAALFPGRTELLNVDAESLQGERAILDIIAALGIGVEIDAVGRRVTIVNDLERLRGEVAFDVSDCPNITPTLAALGAFVEGRFRVTGARITRFHKSSRIDAMVSELAGAGVDIKSLYHDGVIDGFEVRGRPTYPGGNSFSSWGDHRIFMSLFIASLRMKSPCFFSGFEGVDASFPDFFAEFRRAGVDMSEAAEAPSPRAAHR